MTTTVAKIILAPREREVLVGLADGETLPEVACRLNIRRDTAAGYLKFARQKLHGVSDIPAAVAVAYATEAITRPDLRDPELMDLPREQRRLVPLIALGAPPGEMAAALRRPLATVRHDGRELLRNLNAKNRAHVVSRAWQYRILTADQVLAWLP
ncbi:hypothetical protein ACWGIV_33815 [Streptomyces sp. NPDC054844]